MTTRVTHLVRVRNKNNPQIYIDFQVLDALMMQLPAGGSPVGFLLTNKVHGVTISAAIVDKTGDDQGKGNIKNCSRLSHMERFVNPDDPTQFVDLEILDGFAVQPPNTNTVDESDDDGDQDFSTPLGLPDAGDYNSAQHAFVVQSTKTVPMIVDKVGLGLAIPQQPKTTRSCHVNMVTDAGDTDDHTEFSDKVPDVVPPKTHPWVATIKTDAINFALPEGGEVSILAPPSKIDDIDATVYVAKDPFTGEEHVPPDNTDPNIYAFFPTDPKTSQGANLAIPMNVSTGITGPVNQGMLWWIKKINTPFRPWYWFATVQEPRAFSFFGDPPEDEAGAWGYRGFQFFDFFPVIWILSINNPLNSMGSFGSPSLELCAEEGNWDTTDDLPNVPGFNTLGGGGGSGTFAPFGILPMLEPPIPEDQIPFKLPNIWQLTGIAQPPLANPNIPWNRQTNPYLNPSPALAEQCAKKFRDNWNAVAAGVNSLLSGYQPGGRPGVDAWTFPGQPPGWDWATKWYDPFVGMGTGMFGNGIQPGLNHVGIPLEVFVPASVWTMDVDQLDPAKWDTTKAPPVLWSSE